MINYNSFVYCLGCKERGGALKRGELSKFHASQKRGLFVRGGGGA